MVLYDLGVGDPARRPGAAEGYAACVAARPGDEAIGSGRFGAGTGATIAKWRGREAARPGGLGSALVMHGGLRVAALLAVNAIGEPRPGGPGLAEPRLPVLPVEPLTEGQATTIGVVVTNARLDKTACLRAAQSGHDGLARALDPVHTAGDGDALVVAATGAVDAPVEMVRTLAAWVVEQAVADAVGAGT
jgi:L-aminopeptidase/D-esterase-like protein